ncbi:MAG: 4-alpha-glucanotransferase, partial [Candidatus Fournierella pullistercoris]|nr:4-alpha-glucanotransferase [Candidatus Fournierella pullistercoris]
MRECGILMPISSLPGPYGIGSFGKEAYKFVDFLAQAGQQVWQILPLSPTGYGDSPYQSGSAFAGNPYFIDLDDLAEQGLLKEEEYRTLDWGTPDKVDYGKLYQQRFEVLRKAHERFCAWRPEEY